MTGLVAALPAPTRVWSPQPPTGRPRFGVPTIDDVAALAAWLNLSLEELDWFAARGRWSVRAAPRLRHYRVARIAKRGGGVRIIEAPKERLATIQRTILDHILIAVPPHPAAHGFVRGHSVIDFAQPHTGRRVLVREDLRHCFEHVTYPRVKAVFGAIGYPPPVATYLAGLCTTVVAVADRTGLTPLHAALLRERHLPQGAPPSPALLNLVLRRLDFRIAGYAAAHHLTYTRYADDLAFSGDEVDVGALRWFIGRVVASEGFVVHPDKTQVMYDHQRQRLGGLVVNEGVRASRHDFDALKALLHNAARTGGEAQNRAGLPDFRAHVYGRIEWVSTGSPERRARLLAMAGRVDWG
ncbi:MAG: reverse transcriptase family protein [Gordonia sp. (in: high G+C Gram-positive bacteria)]|uniref:reverse transcriptase family protein n=1 Tax=Gordonia sp. (in: high G+C Gram-positive bacteria) TaxID=84139 RepID=UPI0039E558A1